MLQHPLKLWIRYLYLILLSLLGRIRTLPQKHASVTLQSLPTELLQEILGYLDWKSILSLKSTCQLIYNISDGHNVWENVVRQLEGTIGARLEEELEEYTSEELKSWCLRRIKIHTLWKKKHFLQLSDTMYKMVDEGIIHWCSLTSGGRWLIAATDTGLLYFMDLDAPVRESRELINMKYKDHIYATWVDRSKRRLSFRICAREYRTRRFIKIYQVDLVGHGLNAMLVATLVSQFSYHGPHPAYMASNDKYYIEQHYPNYNVSIKLFHYKDGRIKTQSQSIPDIEMPVRPGVVELVAFISTFKFIVQCGKKLRIYSIIPFHGSHKPRKIDVLKKIRIPVVRLDQLVISRPFRLPDVTRIIIWGDNKFRGISIPYDDPTRSTITTLGKYNLPQSDSRMMFGFSSAFIMNPLNTQAVEIVDYSGDELTGAAVPKLIKTSRSLPSTLHVSEALGRIAIIREVPDGHVMVLEG